LIVNLRNHDLGLLVNDHGIVVQQNAFELHNASENIYGSSFQMR